MVNLTRVEVIYDMTNKITTKIEFTIYLAILNYITI